MLVQVLASAFVMLFTGVESYMIEEIEERRILEDDDDGVDPEANKFAYNTTMREKDFWTCSHGYWGTYRECRCAHPLDETKHSDTGCGRHSYVKDMCMHRPNWACDPIRCIWDMKSADVPFCRIKCEMTRKDLQIIQIGEEQRANYCPKTRCQWHINGEDKEDGVCKLNPNITVTRVLDETFNTTLAGLFPDSSNAMECTRHKCAIKAMLKHCHHYLTNETIIDFKRKCKSNGKDLAARGINCPVECDGAWSSPVYGLILAVFVMWL